MSRLILAVLLPICADVALAQSQPGGPSFEAASVKVLKPGTNVGRLRGGPGTNSPGQLMGSATLKALLMLAYDLKPYQISGPAWMESERYEINAKIPAGAATAQIAAMLQSLLQDRFQLVVRREIRELPAYALVIGKGGPKLKESDAQPSDPSTSPKPAAPRLMKGPDGLPELSPGSDVPRSYEVVIGGSDGALHKLWARREKMQQLADRLSGQLNRAVVDSTGLTGAYDFTLVWSIESAGGMIPSTDPPPDQMEVSSGPVLSDAGLSVFSAVQDQLGLKLEQKRQPLAMLIVEAANKTPAEN